MQGAQKSCSVQFFKLSVPQTHVLRIIVTSVAIEHPLQKNTLQFSTVKDVTIKICFLNPAGVYATCFQSQTATPNKPLRRSREISPCSTFLKCFWPLLVKNLILSKPIAKRLSNPKASESLLHQIMINIFQS